ncbi:Zinc phosphodiesterase ELAC protein 2-like protein [Quillaja saponaria]|uniref:ribonuclease Z n=1 Tax=Quillaja saponaria TaxID=32244 RepID=A0AAD7LE77_QUISA|nr:Zinc phosphodiesterase ELAC protein 2-like protein [Quillaja saponaria]
MVVEATRNFNYNESRAEGGNKSGKPRKDFQLKGGKVDSNTVAYVQILGNGMDTQDTWPSVLLFFDKQRFIFNAGEGLQRFCAEHKVKLSKVDHICLSRVCSETAGGLPGLLLTLAGMGEGISVNVWGPPNLELLVNAMKSFIPHAAMVQTRLISHAAVVNTKSSEVATCSSAATLPSTSKFINHILVRNEVFKISAILLQPSYLEGSDVKPSDISVLYVCELHEIMGKLDKEKADALGIIDKTKYGKLKKGQSVKSDCLDTMVHPSDVMGPPVPGPIVFIVDCPTDSHAEELLSIKSLDGYYSDSSGNPTPKTVNCIIHLTPASVVDSPNYLKWMKKFGSAQHIIAEHKTKYVEIPILKSSARITKRLNYLCPQFFPPSLQRYNNATAGSTASNQDLVSKPCGVLAAENLLKFTLRPHLGLDKSNIPSLLAPSDVIDELLAEIPEVVDAAQCVSQFWYKSREKDEDMSAMQDSKVMIEEPYSEGDTLPSCLEKIRRDDLEIVLLGTGSSQPSKYRNVSSIYINLFSKGGLLLDCGEGTLAQLKRRYGMEAADNAVRNLRCIWISHIHADHHAGLTRILALRRDFLKGVPHEPLLVIGPRQLQEFLDLYQRLEDLDMQFLDCRNTVQHSWEAFEDDIDLHKNQVFPGSSINAEAMNAINTKISEPTSFVRESYMQACSKRLKLSISVDNGVDFPLLESLKNVLNDAGLERLVSFPVVHCPEAFGVVLKAAERINNVGEVIPGWKVVYSGDTRPCPEVIEASHGAAVLIHEATFEDCMVGEALEKNHSTTKEAIEVGDSATAYRIILTHFSQRYPKIPTIDETSMKNKTCIAFDLMSVNIADLPVLPNVLTHLKLLFRHEIVDDKLDVL